MVFTMDKAAILDLCAKPLEPVKVETPHGTFHVAKMTAGQLSRFFAEVNEAPDSKSKAVELSHILVNEFGVRMFGPEDVTALDSLPAEIASPCSVAFRTANGMTPKG